MKNITDVKRNSSKEEINRDIQNINNITLFEFVLFLGIAFVIPIHNLEFKLKVLFSAWWGVCLTWFFLIILSAITGE